MKQAPELETRGYELTLLLLNSVTAIIHEVNPIPWFLVDTRVNRAYGLIEKPKDEMRNHEQKQRH